MHPTAHLAELRVREPGLAHSTASGTFPTKIRSEQGAFTGAAYPEHVALTCSDVVAVARRARRRGLAFLPVPRNYYEDLVARFDLDAEFVAELESHGLLYDRDERGEFLHFYTATLGEVFVEVVERRGGYEGFGAPNAPVRLAAQYREFGG